MTHLEREATRLATGTIEIVITAILMLLISAALAAPAFLIVWLLWALT
jgi:hypothetical protein